MTKAANIRIGTAGWSIPRASAFRFEGSGTHLERYSRSLRCAEINSSFHRPHAVGTYEKWRDSTPPDFRFAVKVPRTITHELKLRRAREPFVAFLNQTDGLAQKRGPILVQLPPSFAFDATVVTRFLKLVRAVYQGPVVWEPRHAMPAAGAPGGWRRLAYFRLHGSPRKYWSRYDEHYIESLATAVSRMSSHEEVWCVFDNTASGAAIENAWELAGTCTPVSPASHFATRNDATMKPPGMTVKMRKKINPRK
jgi:uncharacterized protein YecE (DUF72 family)